VEVEGSWDNWSTRTTLQRSGKDFTIIKLLAPGVYQYKYIVDGQWRYAPNLPAMYDDIGNINNVIEVQEFIPENLENLTGFEPPPSHPDSYCLRAPAVEDYSKDAPALPPHLQLTLLNVPPAMDAAASLPRPLHVVLSHMFVQKGSNSQVLVLGSTQM
jgi:5'-AMP-activated protein kinase, regulatory beta subunit